MHALRVSCPSTSTCATLAAEHFNPLLYPTAFLLASRGVNRYLVDVCADMGRQAPPLDALGSQEPEQPEATTEFWAAFHALQSLGVKVNHSHNPDLIAINVKQFAQLACAHGLPLAKGGLLKDALRQSKKPRFLDMRTVRSAIVGSAIYCWTFQANQLAAAEA